MSDRSERQQWPARGARLHPRGAVPCAPAIPLPCFPSALMAIPKPNPTVCAALTGRVAVAQTEAPSLPVRQAGRVSAADTYKNSRTYR
jgi:hypothetical protein